MQCFLQNSALHTLATLAFLDFHIHYFQFREIAGLCQCSSSLFCSLEALDNNYRAHLLVFCLLGSLLFAALCSLSKNHCFVYWILVFQTRRLIWSLFANWPEVDVITVNLWIDISSVYFLIRLENCVPDCLLKISAFSPPKKYNLFLLNFIVSVFPHLWVWPSLSKLLIRMFRITWVSSCIFASIP